MKSITHGKAVEAALNRAARKAFACHRQAGRPVLIWKNGRVVSVKAETLLSRTGIKRRTG